MANLGAMDDRDLAVEGYYRNDDVGIESFVMFIIVFGIWVLRVANLGAMDDRDLTVEGYYRNDDVLTESIVMFIIVFGIWVIRVAQ